MFKTKQANAFDEKGHFWNSFRYKVQNLCFEPNFHEFWKKDLNGAFEKKSRHISAIYSNATLNFYHEN